MHNWHGRFALICLLDLKQSINQSINRPDITVMVGWALKINYLSIYLAWLVDWGADQTDCKMLINMPKHAFHRLLVM